MQKELTELLDDGSTEEVDGYENEKIVGSREVVVDCLCNKQKGYSGI